MSELRIREAGSADLPQLTHVMGQEPYFTDRLSRQKDGLGRLLVAWQDDRPVGVVYLWLEPAEEAELREHLPDTPLLTHLETHVEHRARGIGTSLVRAAEQWLTEKGYDRVALAVETTNDRAARLYARLGYREWPHSTVRCLSLTDSAGRRNVEICRIMVKPLVGRPRK
ncbi:GNAT family N-acetyltransferase [Amycolatopsis sp. YIM 10]|uniref:GNAT family N-acetyltransferase n=1 Tax=Amycolatopsis sp. YIM 10 TaxID=2653857 RepID=UPI0012A8C00F|nr:GNAT family N-acetyltransferase [Amycolatopsis sp. YIM 10]QFU90437.1 putative acetyltransferase [Amycolatopsis sp. YIM 10]